MNKTTASNLFLEKSYQTILEDYEYSLNSPRAISWDWVFITASNDMQAESYWMQIKQRLDGGYLHKQTRYVVLPDPDGKRVGSGGATLNVLKYLSEHSDKTDDFLAKKILVIHSGGDSRRIPQYSVCGKLFSPVPRILPDGRRSVLFDEIIISLSALPNRMNHGMLIISGDVLMLFNPFQVDLKLNKSAAAISIKETIEVGTKHGVYLASDKNTVAKLEEFF
jgi:fucokinase